MSELTDFFVSIGIDLSEDSARKAVAKHAEVERKLTETQRSEAGKRAENAVKDLGREIQEREKIEAKAADRRRRLKDDEFKKDADQRRKQIAELAGAAEKVALSMASIGAAFVGSAAFQSIARTASQFSNLAIQSTRTGGSGNKIQSLFYALGQAGVSSGEADSSFEGFTRSLREQPGLKALLRGKGLNADGDTADLFADLGKYFRTLPYQVALTTAGNMGIGENAMKALRDNEEQVRKARAQREGINKAFGINPEEAEKNAREFSQAYNHLATDLSAAQQRIDTEFFKPLAKGMEGLAQFMEKNAGAITALTAAMEALSAVLVARAVPALLSLFGLKTPAWLAGMLGLPGFAAGAIAGAQAYGSQGEYGLGALSDEQKRIAARQGRALGGLPAKDTRNWWQRTMPKALGGKDAPGDVGKIGLSGGRLTPGQAAALIRKVGGTPEEAAYLGAIQAAESGGNPNSHNANAATGDDSYGLWQINMIGGLEKERLAKYGLRSKNDLKDPETNARVALAMKRAAGGYGDWSVYKSGAYRQYLPAARAGAMDDGSKPAQPRVAYWAKDSKGNPVPVDARGNSIQNYRLPVTSPIAPWAGALPSEDSFKLRYPLGTAPSSINNSNSTSRGDTSFNQTVHVHGASNPQQAADAVNQTTLNSSRTLMRNLEGSTN